MTVDRYTFNVIDSLCGVSMLGRVCFAALSDALCWLVLRVFTVMHGNMLSCLLCVLLLTVSPVLPKFVQKTVNHLRKYVVPSRKRIAITIYWLAHGSYYDDVHQVWGVHKTTVYSILHETVGVMEQQLFHATVKWPSDAETLQNMADFESLCGLPQCAGAIDGCFIPMETPAGPFGCKYWCYNTTNIGGGFTRPGNCTI